MKKLLIAAALCAAPLIAFAAAPAIATAVDTARLAVDIKTLSSDEFEGRAPASAGEEKTVAYLIAQLRKIGLEPGGDLKDGKRAWTQDVPLARFQIIGTPSLGVTVGGKTTALTQGEEIAIRAAQTNVDSVTFANAPIVFAGYGIKAPERDWDDFKGMDLKGKIVLVLINDADFETGQGDFGGKAMTYYGRWTYKFEEAARQGALGFIVVHETGPASYGWATVKNSNTNEMFDIVRDDPTRVHAPVEGWVQRDTAAAWLAASGFDYETLKRQAQTRAFQPVELKGVTLSGDYKVKHEVIISKNVVGLLPGTTRPDETVFYTAHWDHLGIGRPDAKGDTIYNGAVDNATGTAALLEMARLYKAAPRTDRSIVFLWVTAEERGLLGSEYYAANPLYPLSTTVGVLNTDALDPTGPARDFTISGNAKLELLDMLVAEGAKRSRTYTPDPSPEAGYFFRSDHFPFAKRGVPAISFGSGQDMLNGGLAAGQAFDQTYRTSMYHQPADEWSDSWSMDGMAADIALLYGLGRDLATSKRWPEWGEGSEFKAARDATRGERL
ncbi:MAG: M28 family metallopeptidase [Caulobacter sp.]|nr:M28 family metallopeptidase [Caulobacter sp.]